MQVTYTSPRSQQRLEQLYPEADVFVRGYGEPGALLLASHSRQELRSSPELAPALQAAGVHLAGAPDAGAMAQVELQVRQVARLNGRSLQEWVGVWWGG